MKLKQIIHKQTRSQSTQQKLNRQLGVNIAIGVLIVATPFLFYSYTRFPEVKVWETSFFTFESHYYESVKTFAWVFLQKFVFIYLLLIWFFTCREWWKNAILVPIGMLVYQMTILLSDEIFLKDQLKELIILLPFVAIVCFSLWFIGKRLSMYSRAFDLKDEIELRIKEVEKELKNDNQKVNQ